MSSSAESEIADVIERFKRAAFNRDVEAFLALYDREATVFDLWSEWSYRGIEAWRGSVIEWFKSTGENRDAITFEELSITVQGDLALVHAFIRFSCVSPEGNTLRSMRERLSWGLSKKGEWKIVHQHTSAPVDGKDLKIIFG